MKNRMGAATSDVVLRDVTEADLPIFFEQQLDREAVLMAAFPSRVQESFIAHRQRVLADTSVDKQKILYNGQVAGNIVCYGSKDEREVGYWLGKAFWGKGIASKALAAFLQQVKTRPLYAHVAKHNVGSTRVLQKCGFVISGEDKVFSEPHHADVEEYILRLD
jgi:RimJ/RimL family protein N-acetyltransferase